MGIDMRRFLSGRARRDERFFALTAAQPCRFAWPIAAHNAGRAAAALATSSFAAAWPCRESFIDRPSSRLEKASL
ncbi:hypothetical protein HNP32_000854 [Brevundimonas bullata]|uniref:Uncharacterized protein n=2 Tax=Brevundimonas bullata TaxID=13160 RepID=A0A7W7IMM1_9CAUL|nr:hypothetical protein [Brevundimonas bullata]MBB6382099.1 hypothetical protein [Brevundimonas bullata]